MKKIKLIKGLSYSGEVTATAKNPMLEVEDDVAQRVALTGYFAICGDVVANNAQKTKTIDDFTVAELKAFAAAKNIDLQKAKTKSEILAVIKTALDASTNDNDDGDDEDAKK